MHVRTLFPVLEKYLICKCLVVDCIFINMLVDLLTRGLVVLCSSEQNLLFVCLVKFYFHQLDGLSAKAVFSNVSPASISTLTFSSLSCGVFTPDTD